MPADVTIDSVDAMLTTRPAPAARKCGTARRTRWAWAVRLTATVLSQLMRKSSSDCWVFVASATPALLTRMSRPPNAPTTVSTSACRAPRSDTSATTPIAASSPWASRISCTTASTRSWPRSTTATRAPSSAKRCAVARPMPLAAPVTSARLPSIDRDREVRRMAPTIRVVPLGNGIEDPRRGRDDVPAPFVAASSPGLAISRERQGPSRLPTPRAGWRTVRPGRPPVCGYRRVTPPRGDRNAPTSSADQPPRACVTARVPGNRAVTGTETSGPDLVEGVDGVVDGELAEPGEASLARHGLGLRRRQAERPEAGAAGPGEGRRHAREHADAVHQRRHRVLGDVLLE